MRDDILNGRIYIGDFGEEAVCKFLSDRGFVISERNYRTKFGEIDIIVRDGSCLAFVEVKTRKSNRFGEPAEYVNAQKQEKIIKTAMYYLNGRDVEMRFDVAEVFYAETASGPIVTKINYIENAF